ncbi:MAG: ribosome maturation factor RimP [Gemmatimonadales bacterium]|nr:MAG: ribosome maturation factor RimP [Gemmatimonadales bacterium]
MARPIPEIAEELEQRVAQLSLELVEVEWAGSRDRPIIRLRVDRPDSKPGDGVTVRDCVRVSRELEPWLDEHPALAERYTLEVSSPGVERPLNRERDFRRFAGEEVVLKLKRPPEGKPSARLEAELEGVEEGSEESGRFRVRIRLADGERLVLPRDEIERAHLLFRWDDKD